ncbi:MAG: tRNA 2-thiouridine(34) synthase MnmA, partial [Lachnospiraceae bacterium]|nr:tRNA 2-thiouridine(34) synthase MnmA [Lachnospiraceae bacterium]
QKEQPATVTALDDNTIKVVFDEPQRAITKGQAVVMYDGDIVVGGGMII